MTELALSHHPTGVRGAYLRLWRAGFRWLYLLDAVGILGVVVVVTLVRFTPTWFDLVQFITSPYPGGK